MKLTKEDKQIFVTSLNKLDNERARELVQWALSGQFLDDNVKAEKWDKLTDAEGKVFIEGIMNLEKENKQLKEALDMWRCACLENEFQYERLKQKLEEEK